MGTVHRALFFNSLTLPSSTFPTYPHLPFTPRRRQYVPSSPPSRVETQLHREARSVLCCRTPTRSLQLIPDLGPLVCWILGRATLSRLILSLSLGHSCFLLWRQQPSATQTPVSETLTNRLAVGQGPSDGQ
ncbi:hypothetical protein FA10DRAFT_264754 [Acaromyces ingoldii]|uniref:Uncharacterized protein n=1 Tax=Acaromyces ingoldii TaxID=215250 RepID=A0A316YYC8_9BASI|nr:hypothetical protein FA10DRAFT_264754 [Acaromyces ingoldii]PWN94191.1 hypothetical protein FA10DRAFT_264754 [Acaromyces ingoldii]